MVVKRPAQAAYVKIYLYDILLIFYYNLKPIKDSPQRSGLTLYAVLRICDGWQYTPVVFAAVFLLGVGAFGMWARYSGGE
jgi:hypothetical protein